MGIKSKNAVKIVSAWILAILAAGFLFFYFYQPATAPERYDKIFCTQDAKQCSDGSYVGRTGPKCEFAACLKPSLGQLDISTWKTYRNEKYGFEFKYPPELNIVTTSADQKLMAFTDKSFGESSRGERSGIYLTVRDESIQQIDAWCNNENPQSWDNLWKGQMCARLFPKYVSKYETSAKLMLGDAEVWVLTDITSKDIAKRNKEYFFQKGKYIFALDDAYFNSVDDIAKILSTFKFLE